MHFTTTGSSWINQVERWFGLLTDQLLRRGVHKSVAALEKRRPRLDHYLERQPKTIPLDQTRRRDPRLPRQIYGEDFRRRFTSLGDLCRMPAQPSNAERVGLSLRCEP